LVQSNGYLCEEHTVRTHDGYILKIHRIPYGSSEKSHSISSDRPPVLLQHGTYASSGVWVANKDNLAFLLADSGFDVWLANVRGNEYGRQHEKFDINSHDFWKFTYET
jgi:lysosomal acid lipase/cholesteryl ester hydrolase